MGGMLREVGDLSPAEDEMKKMRVIIDSMTKQERQNYKLIKESRMERIAIGSGNKLKDIKDFLNKFRQMEKMMGGMMQMMKGGGLGNMMGGGGGMPDLGAMGGIPGLPGGKKKKKGKKKGPWGGGYF